MDSHIYFSLCANQVSGGIAFIQRNPSFLMENAEASRSTVMVVWSISPHSYLKYNLIIYAYNQTLVYIKFI